MTGHGTGLQPSGRTSAEAWIAAAGFQACNCKSECGDIDDEFGVCKSLPDPPRKPLIDIVLVRRGE